MMNPADVDLIDELASIIATGLTDDFLCASLDLREQRGTPANNEESIFLLSLTASRINQALARLDSPFPFVQWISLRLADPRRVIMTALSDLGTLQTCVFALPNLDGARAEGSAT
jgi:hypothetical protein